MKLMIDIGAKVVVLANDKVRVVLEGLPGYRARAHVERAEKDALGQLVYVDAVRVQPDLAGEPPEFCGLEARVLVEALAELAVQMEEDKKTIAREREEKGRALAELGAFRAREELGRRVSVELPPAQEQDEWRSG